MARILFDITAGAAPFEWSHCNLVMELGRSVFSYAVLDAEKKLLQLRFYELEAKSYHELPEELRGIIDSDPVLKEEAGKKNLVYNFPESQLVPEKYFQAGIGADLSALLYGDLNNALTFSEKMEGLEQYNIYQVPAGVHQLLQDRFGNAAYRHYYSTWMSLSKYPAGELAAAITVLFYPNQVLVSVIKNGQLNLLQRYGYEAAEDVAYYLLNICGQLQLSSASTPVILSGMIDASSALYTEIYKYFGQVLLESFPAAATEPALADYPDHFFSPLLKLAACVS